MGINVTSPCNTLGYGYVGLNILMGLKKAGQTVAWWPIGPTEAPRECAEDLQEMVNRRSRYSTNWPSLRIWHQFDLAQHVGRKLHAAMPIFELDQFKPNEYNHLDQQDLLLVNSGWARQVCIDNGLSAHRVKVVPLGVDDAVFRPVPTNQGGPTVFGNIGKWELRKGHDVIVDAFNKAFTKKDDVRLLMNCCNPCFNTREEAERYNNEWTRLYKTSALGEKIEVNPLRFPTQTDVARFMSHLDCGVFPSRGEGWNMDLAEMMAMGKHVIATEFSAHTEYCTAMNSKLIRVNKLEDAHDGIWFHADDPVWEGNPGLWAHLGNEQVDQLVEHMREVHKAKQEGSLGVNTAGIETMQRYTWGRTAKEIIEALHE